MPLPETIGVVGGLIWTLGLRVSVILLILAVADFAYQKYEYEKSLKMSLSEIKQEMKQSDGDPQIKARIRRTQREMAKRRMMQDVPKADVIITNPTHFAVALPIRAGRVRPQSRRQRPGRDRRPHPRDRPRTQSPPRREQAAGPHPLRPVEIGREIPADLYEAVAQVLAFVYRTYGRRRA